MTRKKFVKRLMGYGYSRNHANKVAARCYLVRQPYAEYLRRAFVHIFYKCPSWKKAVKAAARATRILAEKVNAKPDGMVLHHPVLITSTNAQNFLEKNMQVMPLAAHEAAHDGLRVDFPAIDEWDKYGKAQWPKENPYTKGGGKE